MKALGVIGYHHTGKTTLVTALVGSLTRKGYKVATIKDIHNENYHADAEGTNTWKHLKSGAVMTYARGLKDSALLFPKPLQLKEIVPLITCDYLIIEGWKDAPVPKLLCAQNTDELEELYDDTVIAISGKLADSDLNWQEPPILNAERDLDKLTDLVTAKVFDLLPDSDPDCCSECGLTCYEMAEAILKGERSRSDCKTDSRRLINVCIDGKPLVLVPFVQKLLHDNLMAFLGNLKGVNHDSRITIEL